ncbi:hypothetical protein [Varibaculum vaginae]|uniref:hypothetical protein n=1 Tax=Varibaculum vaginae TaxID=2364797 RepID=UPI000F0879E5|nr:hypothetical protein [Varibaculum vaginae]
MNPENEAKEENLEQDGKVTEQLPEQENNQDAPEPSLAAHGSQSMETGQETEPKPESRQPVLPAGAQSGASAASVPLTQESFQPASFVEETGAKSGKIASFFRKTWVKAVTLVGAAVILFLGGMGSGMAISNHGGGGHMPPGHGGHMPPGQDGQMAPDGRRGGDLGPCGPRKPGQNAPGGQYDQMAPDGQNQNGQEPQPPQDNQNQKLQNQQKQSNSQNGSGGTSGFQNQSIAPSNNS